MTNIYEVYKQDIGDREIVSPKVIRYRTIHKKVAFRFMNDKNKLEGKNVWRVAVRVSDMIIFDVDDIEDTQNIKNICEFYKSIFGDFEVWQTHGGYHIHSKIRYQDDLEWSYDTMRVLNPLLERQHVLKYAVAVKKWYERKLKEEFELKLTKEQFLNNMPKDFTESGLYTGRGNFDILFALNVILKGYYCIRVSKKSENDKPILLTL